MWPLEGIRPEAGNQPPNIPTSPRAGISEGAHRLRFLMQGRGQHSSLTLSVPTLPIVSQRCGSYPAQKSSGLDLSWLVSCFWMSAAPNWSTSPTSTLPATWSCHQTCYFKESSWAFPIARGRKTQFLSRGDLADSGCFRVCSEVGVRKPAAP